MLIRQTLESNDEFQVFLAETGAAALVEIKENKYSLAILDADIQDMSVVKLGRTLRQAFPDVALILVPPGNDFEDDTVSKLEPQGLLTKPFYLPELIDIVKEAIGDRFEEEGIPPVREILRGEQPSPAENKQPEEAVLPPWLEDRSLAADYLKRLTLSSSSLAEASLIIRDGSLWAFVGELSKPSAQEMAENVTNFWEQLGGSDLARFVRLVTTGDEYLIFATRLVGSLVLAVVFDTRVPFRKIRFLAGKMVKILTTRPVEAIEETELRAELDPGTQPHSVGPPPPTTIPSDWQPSQTPGEVSQNYMEEMLAETEEPDMLPRVPLPYEAGGVPRSEQEQLADVESPIQDKVSPEKVKPLLDIPAEEPETALKGSPLVEIEEESEEKDESENVGDDQPEEVHPDFHATVQSARNIINGFIEELPWEDDLAEEQAAAEALAQLDSEAAPAVDAPETQAVEEEPPEAQDEWIPLQAVQDETDQQPEPEAFEDSTPTPSTPVPDYLAETRPSMSQIGYSDDHLAPTLQHDLLEPSSAGLYSLKYACVLIPRFPDHHLTGTLAAHLNEWLPQIAVAFGWRVEHISTRPTHFQWMVNLPPATSPGYLIRIVRRITSQRIFAEYPRLQEDNPSGDFWAPGYLITSSPHPPSTRMIDSFIEQTRRRQGLAS